jgi:amidophosphoribosyltransferase
MCGICAVISKSNRSDLGALIHHGLYHMDNRGDFSAGIATIRRLPFTRKEYRFKRKIAVQNSHDDFDPFTMHKGRGHVSNVFTTEDINSLVGFMGIGQVRYPTAGYTLTPDLKRLPASVREQMERDSIQPLATQDSARLAMVHNGDVHNYEDVMARFKRQKIRRGTNNDLEAILLTFAEQFFMFDENVPDTHRLAQTVEGVFQIVKGTYCALTLVNNVGLVAFRDPEGRRPLHIGVSEKKGKVTDYAFASETVALEKMLFKPTKNSTLYQGELYYDEVLPGEMVFVSKDFELYREQIVPGDLKFCPFECAYFQRGGSYVGEEQVKYIREDMMRRMWDSFVQDNPVAYSNLASDKAAVVIVPVPRTAESAAIELGNYLRGQENFKMVNGIEKKLHSPRIFMQPTQRHREIGTLADHYIYKRDVRGKKVILIDDSIVRGTTMKHLLTYLRNAGATEIHLFITFPAIRNPCNHAIDFHTAGEVYAHGKTDYDIKSGLGLRENETLTFVRPEQMSAAARIPLVNLCNDCYRQ